MTDPKPDIEKIDNLLTPIHERKKVDQEEADRIAREINPMLVQVLRFLAGLEETSDEDIGLVWSVAGSMMSLDIQVPRKFRGRIIGRQGKLVYSLRNLMTSIGFVNYDIHITLQVTDVEP